MPTFDINATRKPRVELGQSPADLIKRAREVALEAPMEEEQAAPEPQPTPLERARQDGLQALVEYVQALVQLVPTETLVNAYEPLHGAGEEERVAAIKAIDEATIIVELQYDQYGEEA